MPNPVSATSRNAGTAAASSTQTSLSPTEDQTIQQCIHCLQAGDDTTQFVGLALLSSILNHVQDYNIREKLWDAINPTFLDRLLRAGSNQDAPTKEDQEMVELAINVIHGFATILRLAPETPSMTGRTQRLVEAIPKCSNEAAATIVETLSVLATGKKGARAILTDYMPLVHASATQDGALPVITQAIVKLMDNSDGNEDEMVIKVIETTLPKTIEMISEAARPQRLRILAFLSDLFSRIPDAFLPADQELVIKLYDAIRKVITCAHTQEERSHITIITAVLLNAFPSRLLFISHNPIPTKSEKPFTYLFVQLLLIDIQSAIPSLLEQLSSSNYAVITQRLAAGYDIVSAFIAHLVMIESLTDICMDANHLLKLKSEITNTFTVTIEFLRDRWDAAYAGASGLDTSYRDLGAPLSLTWDTKLVEGGAPRDPLVISAVRALSLWLREDESLRKDGAGLMDLFFGLWKQSSQSDVDYRNWIVGALEGIVSVKYGRTMFLKIGGWNILWSDFIKIYADSGSCEEELQLALEALRVLVEVVRFSTYMEILLLESKFSEVARIGRITVEGSHTELRLDVDVSVLQLAAEIWKKLPQVSRERAKHDANKLCELSERLGVILSAKSEAGSNVENQDALYVLAEVVKEFGIV